ncbi:6-phospho-3-hexuloisomerase [Streptococcus sp. H49]
MFQQVKNDIISEIKGTLDYVDSNSIDQFIELIEKSNRVFFVGVGRVLLSLQAIAKRWNHLGIQTCIVGDITEPAITSRDILIVGSGSGRTAFPLIIAEKAKKYGATVVHIGTTDDCPMSNISDYFICIPASNKLEQGITSIQPMTSLFEQSLLLFGDTLSLIYIRKHHLNMQSLWQFHANLE